MMIHFGNRLNIVKCLYENEKFEEANWICSDLILDCRDPDIKAAALELNGHCLMEKDIVPRYIEGMMNFNDAYELTSSPAFKLRISFDIYMYKYLYGTGDIGGLQHVILPWTNYADFPKLLMEKGRFERIVEFVIDKSIQENKSKESEEAQNHLMFCNSVMITKKFRK